MADIQQGPDTGLYTYDAFTGRGPVKKQTLIFCGGVPVLTRNY